MVSLLGILLVLREFYIHSNSMAENPNESTNKLLRVIISLLIRRGNDRTITLRQQIEILENLGVKPAEIAEILGRSSTYVSKELSGIRKTKNKS